MVQTINGLNADQVFRLYDYLVIYEESGIQNYKSTQRLLKEHPELSKLTEINKKVIYKKISKAIDINIIDPNRLNNKIYLTISKGNLLLSFLSHLRNAIAHGNVVAHEDFIVVSDRNPNKSIVFTARGRIKYALINEITKILKDTIL